MLAPGLPLANATERPMMLGLSFSAFTTLHVLISLIGIATGLLTLAAMLRGRHEPGMTAAFLGTTILTSVTGFMFPAAAVTPAHIVGAISLVVLAVAVAALYFFRLAGLWRALFAGTAIAALYFNVFVAVAQAFQKFAPLARLAPTQSEPPFAVAQTIVLLAFLYVGTKAVKGFRTPA